MEAPSFGAIQRTVDERDLNLGEITSVSAIPAVHIPDISSLSTHHQHKLPTCGANAFAWLQESQFKGGSLSPRYSWLGIKKIDGFALEDGTDMRSIFKSGQTDGACSLSVCADDSLMELHAYSNPSIITSDMKMDGKTRLIQAYAFQNNPSMSQIKQAIFNHGSVIALIRVGEEFWTSPSGVVSWQEKDTQPLRTPTKSISGHFIVLYGYDEQYVYFKNSWGDTYGRMGSGYFGDNYLPYVIEMGTVVNVDKGVLFKRDLAVGASGADVTSLQKYLIKQGFSIPAGATGYFGAQTKSAVAEWQKYHGITPSIGYFGPKSRAFIN